jgi:transcriptional regulator with XRE-family HTH domain
MRNSHIHQPAFITWRVKKNIYTEQHNRLINLLREMRVKAGLTQLELAALIKKDQTFISKYESGQRRLDILEVREICQAIGTTLEKFVRRLEKALK